MSFTCKRCGAVEGQFEKSPYPGPFAQLILENTCEACWNAWMDASLIMLNEYRLNLLDPKHAEMYDKQLLMFLKLSEDQDGPRLNLTPPEPVH
jgi:Fe-S cluster biosynthesis and repair protein YggX